MGTFTHEDTGYNTSTSSTSLAVTLSNAVAAGDLLVLWVQARGAGVENTSVRDDAGNVWTNAYNGQLWYCAAALAAPHGVTITATVTTNAVYQIIVDRFTPSGPVIFGGYAVSGSAGTEGLNYNGAGCGDLGTVQAGALAWGAFSVNSGAGDQTYTPGFQTGKTSPADVIGSQFNGANGTGLSMYVTDCANEDATLTWYGTGSGGIGSSGSMSFTVAPSPPPLFTHEDSAIAQATSNVSVITVTLTKPVAAGDLLVCAAKSPDGSMTSANLSDSAGNTWTVAGGGNFLYLAYCLASNAAPDGLTVTVTTQNVSHHGIVVDRFTPASGYTAEFSAFSDNLDLSSVSTGLNYPYGNHPPGTITSVPSGDLAYMGFFVLLGDPSCVYSGGYQDGSSGTSAVIGSQVTESNGDGGFSEYVASTNLVGTVAMQWYGTGGNYGGWAVQGTFTAVPISKAPSPPPLFTHEDSAIAQATSNVSVITVTLTKPVAAGDLLVCAAKSPDGSMTSANLSDSAGNTWTVAGGGNFLYLAYCLASNAAPDGLTVTVTTQNVSHHGIVVDRFTPASGYTAEFSAFSDNLDLSSFSTGLNYPYGNHPPGTITSVPSGDLAYMGFFVITGNSSAVYSGGYQDGLDGAPAVIGSQVTESNGDGGFSEYVASTNLVGTVAMQWYGTGGNYGGWAVQGTFTAVPISKAPPPPPLFTHEDSAIAQATSNVSVITVTLTKPVAAGDLLVCAAKSPDGSMTSANLSDSAGNTWTVAGGGNFLYLAYCLASNAAPDGLTVTVTTQNVSHHGIVVDRFTPASGYTAEFSAFSDNLDLSSFSTGLNYPYGNHPPGTITSVPSGDLAYMGFFVLLGDPSCVYSGGYQDGSSGTSAVIGSQVTESNGDGGFSEYVASTNLVGTVAMQWYGTGGNYGGWAVQGTFTAVPISGGLLMVT